MADVAAHFVDLLEVVGQFHAVDDDPPLLMFFQPVDAADHGRLAGADGPQITMRSPPITLRSMSRRT